MSQDLKRHIPSQKLVNHESFLYAKSILVLDLVPYEFCKICKNTIFKAHLRATASVTIEMQV